MDFTLDKKHEMARGLFRDFAETEVKPLAQETDQLVFAQLFIVCHRKINAERIIYMDTRKQIRRSITGI